MEEIEAKVRAHFDKKEEKNTPVGEAPSIGSGSNSEEE